MKLICLMSERVQYFFQLHITYLRKHLHCLPFLFIFDNGGSPQRINRNIKNPVVRHIYRN